jgi:hypothetical protein
MDTLLIDRMRLLRFLFFVRGWREIAEPPGKSLGYLGVWVQQGMEITG